MGELSVIAIGDNGWTEIESDLLTEREGSAYGFHKPWWRGVSFFHRDGKRYEVAAATPLGSMVPKILASTIYNPSVKVRYEYRAVGPYSLDDLKRAMIGAIEKDDDILTQFHTAGELKALVARAASFDDAVGVLQYAATEDEPTEED